MKTILRDRFELLNRIKEKFPDIQIKLDSAYVDDIIKRYIRTNDEDQNKNKLNEDKGHGDNNKINGDYSYNIIVIYI